MATGNKFAVLMIAAILAMAGAARADDCAEPVRTAAGLVRGATDASTNTCSWKGIPFAAPPVGELRFRAPEAPAAWQGVRDALEYGSKCMQVFSKDSKMSEDCLYLNVWRPRKSGEFPVMVWIHGGGYVMGSGGEGTGLAYDGSRLAEFGDVVVVTINYRLHAFGFIADPALRDEDPNHSTGNYGSLDQVAGIRWVHDNIAAFGGDPKNVTIFGESAGGWSICTMLATPLNRGMFQRAILESGGCEKSESLEKGYERAKLIAKRVGCRPSDLDCLRAAPAGKFLGNITDLYSEGMPYAPHYDDYLLTGTPLSMIREGNYNQVPFMAGSNRNETDAVLIFRSRLWYAPPSRYEKRIGKNMALTDREAAKLVELYPLDQFENKPKRAYGRIYTDAGLACPTYLGLSAVAMHQPDVYLYRFDYDEMRLGKHIGALHAMEVPLVFGNLDNPLYNEKNIKGARELSRVMQTYWTNFAKTGDPNGPGAPEWPGFTADNQLRQILDATVRTERADMSSRCEFWEDYLDSHMGFEQTLGSRQKK